MYTIENLKLFLNDFNEENVKNTFIRNLILQFKRTFVIFNDFLTLIKKYFMLKILRIVSRFSKNKNVVPPNNKPVEKHPTVRKKPEPPKQNEQQADQEEQANELPWQKNRAIIDFVIPITSVLSTLLTKSTIAPACLSFYIAQQYQTKQTLSLPQAKANPKYKPILWTARLLSLACASSCYFLPSHLMVYPLVFSSQIYATIMMLVEYNMLKENTPALFQKIAVRGANLLYVLVTCLVLDQIYSEEKEVEKKEERKEEQKQEKKEQIDIEANKQVKGIQIVKVTTEVKQNPKAKQQPAIKENTQQKQQIKDSKLDLVKKASPTS